MKRLVTILLSVLLALVMCFSVIACGNDEDKNPTNPNNPDINTPDDDDPNNPSNPSDNGVSAEVMQKAAQAMLNLYTADSYVASVGLTTDSKNGTERSNKYTAEKRGSKIALTKNGENKSYIFDVYTGYLYQGNAATGYVAIPMMPADTVGYFKYVFEQYAERYADGAPETEGTDTDFAEGFDVAAQYDEATKTLTVSIDAAEHINDSLAPVYDAYKKDKTIAALLDDYIKSITNNTFTFRMIFDSLFLMASTNSEATFDEANTMLTVLAPELDLYDLLGNFVEMTDEMRAAIAARTLGEVISGAYDYISTVMANPPTSMEQLQSVAFGLVNAALFGETEYTPEKLEQIKTAVDALLATKFRAVVGLVFATNPEAVAFISSGVTFTTMTADITLTFDEDYNISKLTADCALTHSYTGDAENFRFLSNNEYVAKLDLELSDYSDTHEAFEGATVMVVNANYLSALVYGDVTDDVSVYIETAGEDMPEIAKVSYYYMGDESSEEHTAQATVATVDSATSSIVIDADFINEVINGANGANARIEISFGNDKLLYLVYADDAYASDVILNIAMNLMQLFG